MVDFIIMLRKHNLKLSLKIRVIIFFLGTLTLIVGTYFFTLHRFVANFTRRQLDTNYQASLSEVYDKVNNILWSLTLTSQQLIENETLQTELDEYLNTPSQYQKSELYKKFTTTLYSLTMANMDVALISFRLTDQEKPFYSTVPIRNDSVNAPLLFQNQEFSFLGPSASQCNLFGNPVLTLNRSGILPDGRSFSLCLESGLYSLHAPLQSIQKQSAYLAFTDHQGNLTYSTFTNESDVEQLLKDILSEEHADYRSFSKQNSQGWAIHIIIPNSVYAQDYYTILQDFILCTIMIGIIFFLFASAFYKSIYHPLQMFDYHLNRLLTDEFLAEKIHSTIPEYERLITKISELQYQIQEMIHLKIEQEKIHSNMQLDKLRAQINPHFLLNTLNTLHWMALINHQSEIDAQIQALSHLLNYNLDKDTNHTNIGQEAAAMQEYVNLQKIRYDFQFCIETSAPLTELNYPCPKFILQPLVENALLHGYQKGMVITLGIRISEHISIELKDTGIGMNHETLQRLQNSLNVWKTQLSGDTDCCFFQHSDLDSDTTVNVTHSQRFGIGMQYVIHSLHEFYDGEFDFSIQSIPDKGTCIRLELPKLKGTGYYDKNFNR